MKHKKIKVLTHEEHLHYKHPCGQREIDGTIDCSECPRDKRIKCLRGHATAEQVDDIMREGASMDEALQLIWEIAPQHVDAWISRDLLEKNPAEVLKHLTIRAKDTLYSLREEIAAGQVVGEARMLTVSADLLDLVFALCELLVSVKGYVDGQRAAVEEGMQLLKILNPDLARMMQEEKEREEKEKEENK